MQCYTCIYISHPQLTSSSPFYACRWDDPAGLVVPETGRIKSVDNTLSLNNAQPEDSGNYSCVAWNMAGEQRQSVWIVVSGNNYMYYYTA